MMVVDPIAQFTEWFEQARESEVADHDAVALASVGSNGRPSIRMVLMREYDARGFVFYTNLGSAKAQHFAANAHAAMCFHWKSTARQIRIEGTIEAVSDEEADRYFQTRPRESQIGAIASKQSQVLPERSVLERRVAELAESLKDKPISRPAFWSGYRLNPGTIEFWDKRPFRLHDRLRFSREGDSWRAEHLYP